MLRILYACAIFSLLLSCAAKAQTFELLYPGLSGQELLDSLAGRYRPTVVLDYSNARDTLYGKVMAMDDDSVRCIYTGHTLYLDPAADPTQYVYLNGASNGMNAEHAYPQAKGASVGVPKSDMHHLFPAKIPVNEARGDSPYGEIPDPQTEKWFYKEQTLNNIPAVNKDLYSEYKAGIFEPRESVKGDLARAVFYFYTMYRSQADAADPNYFELQRPTLCQWQAQDPADSAELVKTWRIAHYQQNKPNPFIVDCSLAFRTYCGDVPVNCTIAAAEPGRPDMGLRVFPNPFSETAQIEMNLPFDGDIAGFIRTATGQELARFEQANAPAGSFHWPISLGAGTEPEIAFLEIHFFGKKGQHVVKCVPIVTF